MSSALAGALLSGGLSGCGESKEPDLAPILVSYEGGGEDNSIWLVSSDGSKRRLTSGDNPRWSPDHRQVVFRRIDWAPQAGGDVWIIRADGTGERRLTSVLWPNQVRYVDFGGRPATIAYDDHEGIWMMRPDGTGLRRLLRDGNVNELDVSPDGEAVAYARNGTETAPYMLKVARIRDGAQRVLMRGIAHTCELAAPSWSPDGTQIAFELCTDKGGLDQEAGIWLVQAGGGDLHRVALSGGSAGSGASPTWSSDGRWIAFVHTNGAEHQAIVKIHPNGTGREPITPYVAQSTPEQPDDPDW